MTLRILLIASEWPTPEQPDRAPFVVQRVDFLRKAGIELDVIPFQGNVRIGNYIRAWRQIRRAIQSGKYDVIDAQYGHSALLAIPKKLPLVVTFHGSDVIGVMGKRGRYTLKGWLLRQISRGTACFADEAIIVSPYHEKMLPRRLYHVIPMGINLELFRPVDHAQSRSVLNLPQDIPLVFFPANPARSVKRYELACEAIKLAQRELPDLEMVTAGQIPFEQMPLYMNACDVLLLTSRHEGSPGVVKEALACNLPVVSVDVGDVRDRIQHVKGCFLCQDDAPSTIASALLSVVSDRQRINSRITVLDMDEALLAQKVIQVYRKAMQSRKSK